ncbi:MAG: glycosyltransferase, partial [Chloroflexota bacterium]
MSRIRVLQLIDGLNIGGAEKLLCDLADGLQQHGLQVSVGYSTPGPLASELAALGVRLQRLPRLARVDPLLLGGMLRLVRREQPHIVHTHLFKSDFHGRLAARLAGVPVVVSTLHNNDAWVSRPIFGRLYGATARFADRLIAVSEEVRQYQLQHTGVPAEKIIAIPNGVDVRRFAPQPAERQAVRQAFGVPEHAPLFGVIGRLKPQKDHAAFLQAAALVLQQLPEARFLVVGDGPLRADLEAQAAGLGLPPALTFAGLRQDMPAIYAALDVLVFSSRWEGLPVTLLEGMAASLPVAATAVDGITGV